MSYRTMGAAALAITVDGAGHGRKISFAGEHRYLSPKPWANAYVFELVDPVVKFGGGTSVTICLVHNATGTIMPDAVLFASRIDMAPDGMAAMTAPLDALSDTLSGYYRFETGLMMTGEWALSLSAKVLGDGQGRPWRGRSRGSTRPIRQRSSSGSSRRIRPCCAVST